MFLSALIGKHQFALEKQEQGHNYKIPGRKNNRRRSEMNPGKTREKGGLGRFFSLPSVRSHLSQQINCSHANLGKVEIIPLCFKDIIIDIDRVIINTIIIYYYYYYYYDIFTC